MSINPEFKPLDSFYKDEDKALGAPNVPLDTIQQDPTGYLMPNPGKAPLLEPNEPVPGFLSTLGRAFSRNNEFMQAGRYVSRELQFSHPLNDIVPEDWNPATLENLQDMPSEWWPWLSLAESPMELDARKRYALEQVHNDEQLANGGFMASLLGGFAGGALSPSSLIPISLGAKFAGFSENIVRGVMSAAPGLAASTIIHEGIEQATNAASDTSELAVNTLRDMAFGTAFIAGGKGLGAAFRGGKLWETRKTVNYISEGIDIKTVVNEDGIITGYKAEAAPGIALSADKVEQAQQFLDSSMSQTGLFAIPGMTKFIGNKFLGSIDVRGLTHRFKTVRMMQDKMSSHAILTEAIEKGHARADTAEDMLSSFNAGTNHFNLNYRNHFFEQNGLEGGYNFKNAARALGQAITGGAQMSEKDFGYKVIDSILTQEFKETKSINAAAKMTSDHLENVYKMYKEVTGQNLEVLSPRNAKGYYPFNPDRNAMINNPKLFEEVTAAALKRQDEQIVAIMAPLREAEARLAKLQEYKRTTDSTETRTLANEIKEEKLRIRQIKKEIEAQARDNEDVSMLLEDRNWLSTEDSDALESLMKPLNDQKKLEEGQIKEVKAIKSQISKTLAGIDSAKTKPTELRLKKKHDELKAKLDEAESLLADIRNKRTDIEEQLRLDALDGKINARFYHRVGNSITWRDPKEWARFRAPFTNDTERLQAARALFQTYTNNSTEQIQAAILSSMYPSQFANPLKKRVNMVPMRDYHQAGFISPDVPGAISAYTRAVGRQIIIRHLFKDVNLEDGSIALTGIVDSMAAEHAAFRAEIDAIPDEAKRQKAYRKLDKDYQDAQKHTKLLLDTFLGVSVESQAARRFTRAARNIAVSTKLGGMLIAQITDLGGIVFKHGLWPFIRDGLIPFVKTWNGYLKGPDSEAWRRYAGDAHMAVQHVAGAYSSRHYEFGDFQDVPMTLWIESALERTAHFSSNFYGTNSMDNLGQRLTASIAQGRIIRNMYEYLAGTLSATELRGLLHYGLDPKDWAEIFVKNHKEIGGRLGKTGTNSYYYEWKDAAAVDKMASTLRRAVKDTIVQKGLYTSPFWTNNSFASSILMFHSYGFAAFNKFLIPLLQRPTANMLTGSLMMLGLGALTDPLRNLANGKPFTDDDDTWFGKAFEAVANSGLLGHTTDMLQTANKMVDGALLPKQTVRFQNWNKMSALGPIAGMSQDAMMLIRDALTGKFNKTDVKRGLRLIPLTGSIATRAAINQFVDSLDLPETAGEASPYSWREQ